jgi:hypothetical protein
MDGVLCAAVDLQQAESILIEFDVFDGLHEEERPFF